MLRPVALLHFVFESLPVAALANPVMAIMTTPSAMIFERRSTSLHLRAELLADETLRRPMAHISSTSKP